MAAPINFLKVILYFIVFYGKNVCFAQVELDERLLELRKDGMWLISFYAPWCGHCKKLEPVFHQVHHALKNSGIVVGKIDSTRYSNVASEFSVRGFPTIKFIKGDKVYTHRGDRSKEDILEFARKAKGPAVRSVASVGKFTEIKTQHVDSVFFMFVGANDADDDMFKKYSFLADKHIIESYFYSGLKSVLPDNLKFKNVPTVLVIKDNSVFEFDAGSSGVLTKEKLDTWIKQERFPAFPQVQGGGLNEMAEAGKFLVLTVLNTSDKSVKKRCKKMKKIVSKVAVEKREKYHNKFQFLWMPDEETANSITMSFLTIPSLVVLETITHHYFLWEKNITELTENTLEEFLDNIAEGKLEAYGGSGFFQKIKRIAFDFFTTILSIWQASRWLFMLMFGLPTVIISIVCYSLCCMETIDDGGVNSDDEDGDEYDERRIEHEQNELNDNQNVPEVDHEKYE